jgi:hypothetical protein
MKAPRAPRAVAISAPMRPPTAAPMAAPMAAPPMAAPGGAPMMGRPVAPVPIHPALAAAAGAAGPAAVQADNIRRARAQMLAAALMRGRSG